MSLYFWVRVLKQGPNQADRVQFFHNGHAFRIGGTLFQRFGDVLQQGGVRHVEQIDQQRNSVKLAQNFAVVLVLDTLGNAADGVREDIFAFVVEQLDQHLNGF